MSQKQKIYNLIILDESGSMNSIKTATVSGFNELVETIRNAEQTLPDQEHFVSLITFNSLGIKHKLDRAAVKSLDALEEFDFLPNGMTPLFDAIGSGVVKLRNHIRTENEARVLVTVLTDGMENASREYNQKILAQIIKDLENEHWTFTYIGANHDVVHAAASININNVFAFEADEDNMRDMFEKERRSRMNFYQRHPADKDARFNYFDRNEAGQSREKQPEKGNKPDTPENYLSYFRRKRKEILGF